MFLGSRPASGNRIGTPTWPYNAQPVLLKSATRSRPQGRNADYTSKWIVFLMADQATKWQALGQ
jgi:hypothetical protein